MARAPIEIAPRWRIVSSDSARGGEGIALVVDPGPGFGDGTHETTQLCLQAIAVLAPPDRPWRMLDFGSGSGILAVGAARMGAIVDAVEIDQLASAHGQHCARSNGVAERIHHARFLEDARGPFDFVVANILRSVLLEFAEKLVARLATGGTLVLSGLVSTDVPEVSVRFSSLLGGDRRPEVASRGEWRALVWRAVRRGDVGSSEPQRDDSTGFDVGGVEGRPSIGLAARAPAFNALTCVTRASICRCFAAISKSV
jgi:ribosomal protein L11 methyltransferase